MVDLPRVDTPDRGGGLSWSATGSTKGRHGALRLDLAVDGEVVLTCQRCLGPMTKPLQLRSRFLIAKDEDAAEALDQDDDYDVVVGSEAFETDTLIEDEVLLALPIAPRHAVCPAGAGSVAPSTKPSPFAALAGWKTTAGNHDGGGDGER